MIKQELIKTLKSVQLTGKTYSEYIEALADKILESDPHWVSVEDRLPEKGGSYIVHSERGAVYVTHYYEAVSGSNGDNGKFSRNVESKITHWQPLPKGPKE